MGGGGGINGGVVCGVVCMCVGVCGGGRVKEEGGRGVRSKIISWGGGGINGWMCVCVCGGGGGGGGAVRGGWQFSIFSVKMKQMWDTSTILSGDLPN